MEKYALALGWDLAQDSYEGVRISFPAGEGDGWFLLRLSVHDPVMPLNIESAVEGGCKVIAEKLLTFLKDRAALNLDPILEYVK